ncbi:hypothetical protein TPENAI_90177 [Tenacibaculum litopenaei]
MSGKNCYEKEKESGLFNHVSKIVIFSFITNYFYKKFTYF